MGSFALPPAVVIVTLAVMLVGCVWLTPAARRYHEEVQQRQAHKDDLREEARRHLSAFLQQHNYAQELKWHGYSLRSSLGSQLVMVALMATGPLAFLAIGASGALDSERKLRTLAVLLFLSLVMWVRTLVQTRIQLVHFTDTVLAYALTPEMALILKVLRAEDETIRFKPTDLTRTKTVKFAEMDKLHELDGAVVFYERHGDRWAYDCLDCSRQTKSTGFKGLGDEAPAVLAMVRDQRDLVCGPAAAAHPQVVVHQHGGGAGPYDTSSWNTSSLGVMPQPQDGDEVIHRPKRSFVQSCFMFVSLLLCMTTDAGGGEM